MCRQNEEDIRVEMNEQLQEYVNQRFKENEVVLLDHMKHEIQQ